MSDPLLCKPGDESIGSPLLTTPKVRDPHNTSYLTKFTAVEGSYATHYPPTAMTDQKYIFIP
jgi:hypothetical protein